VFAEEAAIAHELVHALLPNGNRMLAEGLAVYLQQKLFPRIQVYPNFGRPLEDFVANFLCETYPDGASDALWNMDLEDLEAIPTPSRLQLRINGDLVAGDEAAASGGLHSRDAARFLYAVAGSFVGFLLQNPIADELLTAANFGTLYKSTPLRPLQRYSGPPSRWKKCYRGEKRSRGVRSYSFYELALLWKAYMHPHLVRRMAHDANDAAAIPNPYCREPLIRRVHERLAFGAPRAFFQPASPRSNKP